MASSALLRRARSKADSSPRSSGLLFPIPYVLGFPMVPFAVLPDFFLKKNIFLVGRNWSKWDGSTLNRFFFYKFLATRNLGFFLFLYLPRQKKSYFLPMAGDDGRCGVAVAVVLRAGRQNNQDFSAKITKISAKITKICVRCGRR